MNRTSAGSTRTLVLAPFFSYEATSSRPLVVSEVLARFGTVDIVTTNFDHQKKGKKKEIQFNDRRACYYLPTIPYRENVSLVRFLSHFCFTLSAWWFYLKRKNNYDVVYVTLPLNMIAVLVFMTGGKKFRIADVVDIWPDVLPFPESAKKLFYVFFYVWKKSFAQAVKNCDMLLTVSDRFLDESIRFFSHERSAAQRFYIGYTRLTRRTKPAEGPLTVVYIGNIGHLYDFETLLAALAAFPDKTRFYLIGNGDRKEWLLKELEILKIEHRYFGVVYDDENLEKILANCDVGFNGYRNTTAAFSYKANTYFAAGIPILNSMSGDLERLVAEHEVGFNYISGNTDSLLACIGRCSREALAVLSQNVERFFQTEINQDVIKNKMTDFIGSYIARKY
jgi:glycosyltransferase involved in cell wall biosynthesis